MTSGVPQVGYIRALHPFVTDDELSTWTPAPDLVQGLLSSGDVHMLFAPKNRGKTFLGLHLAYSIATGRAEFMGCKIRKHGSVVYLCAEGRGGLVKRRAAWRQVHAHSARVPGLAFWRELVDIRDEQHVQAVIDQIREHYSDCVLVVIDTLSQHMPGGDEGTSDMSAALHSCQRIRDELGVTVLAMHHPTKADERNERGGSGFRGGCADVLNVEEKNGVFLLKTQNRRDGAKDTDPIAYVLDVVTIDGLHDEDGQPLTSCVVRQVSGATGLIRAARKQDEIDRAVLDAVTAEPATQAAISRTIKRRNAHVGASLQRLRDEGRVTQDRAKRWTLVRH